MYNDDDVLIFFPLFTALLLIFSPSSVRRFTYTLWCNFRENISIDTVQFFDLLQYGMST